MDAGERARGPARGPQAGPGGGGLLRLFRRPRPAPAPTYDDDGSLTVLVESYDAARADSEVLREVDLPGPVLVRHHLVLPPEAVEQARAVLAQDGYRLSVDGADVRAWRTQVLTPLSVSQERSRMAGLAQRLGGDARGWDALGPSLTPPAAAP